MQGLSPIASEAFAASRKIYPAVKKTDLYRSPWLSDKGGCDAYLKLENQQASQFLK